MRFDLVKMPLVPAFLTLAALAAFGLGCLPTGAPVADPRGAIAPGSLPLLPLGAALDRFQALFPLGAKLLGGLLLLFTGSSLGRLSMRYNLYVTTTCLALPLYGAAMLPALHDEAWLAAIVASTLLLLFLRNACLGYRNGFAFDRFFRAALFLSLLVLLCPAALPLLAALPAAIVRFRRTGRELIAALGGLLLPAAAIAYLNWALGGSLVAPFAAWWQTIAVGSPAAALLALPLGDRLVAGLFGLTAVAAFLLFRSVRYHVGTKARHIVYFAGRLFLLALLVLPMPGAGIGTLGLAAVPAALLLPVLFLRLRRSVARLLYLFEIAAAIAACLVR